MAPPSRSCPLPPPGIRYNATMDERRYTPRAHLDEGGDRYTNRAVLLSSSQQHCERINFHVLVSLTPSSPNQQRPRSNREGTQLDEVLPWERQRAQLGPQEAQLGYTVPDLAPAPHIHALLGHTIYHFWYPPPKSLLPQPCDVCRFLSRG